MSDAHRGLKAAIRRVMGSLSQRCRVGLLQKASSFDSLGPATVRDFVSDDHVLARVEQGARSRVEVRECYAADGAGRPGIDPKVALRLMPAGFLVGIVNDRRLVREAQVNGAIRWFAGFGLADVLPAHSSLTPIRQRWGADRFRAMFVRTVQACMAAGIARGELVHVDATLI